MRSSGNFSNPGGKRSWRLPSSAGSGPLSPVKTAWSQGIAIAKEINAMVGGIDMLDAQSCVSSQRETSRDFSEIAILYRTHHEAELLEKCLQRESIPYDSRA